MKTFWSILGVVAMFALLLAVPVRAEMVSVADSDLSGITGKANNDYLFSGTTTTTITANSDSSANIQFGWYQWTDNHDTDGSDHKGANDQSGANSTVQQTITGLAANTLNWGASAQNYLSNTNGTSDGGDEVNMAYGVFANGGF